MPTLNPLDFQYLAPEIALTIWGLVVLIADFGFLRKRSSAIRQKMLGWLSLLGCGAAMAVITAYVGLYMDTPGSLTETTGFETDPRIFFGMLSGDILTFWMNVVIVILLAMAVGMSMAWKFTDHWGEYYALLFWAGVGMMLLVAAEELLTLFLTLEMMTLCLYLAAAFETGRRRSAEGGLKYFVYGSVSSALFLFGLSLIYGMTGSTRLDAIHTALADAAKVAAPGLEGNVAGAIAVLLVLVGFGFKVAAVPFHQWAPDAYEGAPAPVTAWIAAGSKLASFVAMMKVMVHALGPWASAREGVTSPGWIGIVALISAVTMTYGNFAALAQRNLKRMLAYSSIAHAGYILIGVLAASIGFAQQRQEAAGAVIFYLIVYAFTTVGAFALAAWLVRDHNRDDLEDINGLGLRSPVLATCVVLLMLSLIGMPPLAGFFGKLYMFMEALRVDRGQDVMVGLVALGLANSVVSAFYYVRVLKAMFLRPSGGTASAPAPGGVRWPIVVATAVALGFGVFPSPLLETSKGAATVMLNTPPPISRYATDRDPNFVPPTEAEKAERNRRLSTMLQSTGGGPAPATKERSAPTPPVPKADDEPTTKRP